METTTNETVLPVTGQPSEQTIPEVATTPAVEAEADKVEIDGETVETTKEELPA